MLPQSKTRCVGKFEAAAGPDRHITLLILEEVVAATTFAGTGQPQDPPRYVTTEDGAVVMVHLGEGQYRHPVTGEVFYATDPIAT